MDPHRWPIAAFWIAAMLGISFWSWYAERPVAHARALRRTRMSPDELAKEDLEEFEARQY